MQRRSVIGPLPAFARQKGTIRVARQPFASAGSSNIGRTEFKDPVFDKPTIRPCSCTQDLRRHGAIPSEWATTRPEAFQLPAERWLTSPGRHLYGLGIVRGSGGGRHKPVSEVGVGVERDRRDGRQLGPVEAVIEQRRLASRGPSLAGCRQQREAALVDKDQSRLQDLGFFFKRGQVCFTQRWMAASSRSRRAGFCQLQPKRCRSRQT